MNTYLEYKEDLKFCKAINKKYGKSFYAGTLFLNSEQRDATFILYSFFRFPDEYVDTYYANQKDIALEKINHWNDCWKKCYNEDQFEINLEETRVLRATAFIFKKYNIPFECSQDFLKAMLQDTWKERYATYHDLQDYMYGSAGVVGIMMTYIFCITDKKFTEDTEYRKKILYYAQILGEAFQMTNFLRDINEDYIERNRIYIPQEDLDLFKITEQDISNKNISDNFKKLMKFEIKRIQDLYVEADKGINLLPSQASKGVYIARVLYSKIIDKIVQSEYNIFSSRKSLSFFEKISWVLLIIMKIK
jgi:phytoene synthase